MAGLKSLMKDTAIYGVSSIVGRFLNWCLVPLYTYIFASGQYGIVTNVYAYVALILIILTCGLETGFFRFANHERWDNPTQVYTTAMLTVGSLAAVFVVAICLFASEIARWMGPDVKPYYVWMMGVTVGLDAFACIPFAYLRYKKRPVRFALIKCSNIAMLVILNLFFLLVVYNPEIGIGYIFFANLLASAVVVLLLIPELRVTYSFNFKLLREMLRYSFPLLVLGVAGIMNQTLDKMIFPMLYDSAEADSQLGIYGACYKVAIVMVMFIQAFRFAYEPYIFEQNRRQGEDKKQAYGEAMKYFIVFALFIFLGVMFYLDILRYFIAPQYFSGLKVVPIVMGAELFFGIFFNLSLWYKLTDRTEWGTWFSLFGLAITLAVNIIFVPHYSYMACAWAAFLCYGSMMVASYIFGRKYYPIDYPLGRIGLYVLLAAVLYAVGLYLVVTPYAIANYAIRALLLGIYIAAVLYKEKPLAVMRRG